MTRSDARDLTQRITRPQRIGLFGRRGVGKTTLLAALYREAAGGRLPGLRLAAADAATAQHLADKIAQLEAGHELPATLAQTPLRFHLYCQGSRVELVLLDYQGEHIALGRDEPVRDFLRDCDAVLLCLDAPVNADEPRWQAEQEVEQVVEDYLATQRAGEPHRPMALVVTKADRLAGDRDAVRQRLALTHHALSTHCPWHETFFVSCFAGGELKPAGLDAPLAWLADALLEQDKARLEHLWSIAPHDHHLLGQATAAFARRHPDAEVTGDFLRRLTRARRQRLLRRLATVAVALVTLSLGLWGYDAWGESRVRAVARQRAEAPAVVRQAWLDYRTWHPTRRLTRPGVVRRESEALAELHEQIRQQQREQRYADIRRRADDPDADAEELWADFVRFRDDFADFDLDEDGAYLRVRLKQASDARRDHKARVALTTLDQAERSKDLTALSEQAAKLAARHAGSGFEAELLRRQATYLKRLDESDFEAARDYSTRNPHNHFTRRQKYQQYLDRHPAGAFAVAARSALAGVARDWDRYDYRAVRDRYVEAPGDLADLRTRGRAYLAAHADGKYRDDVSALLRWCDKVSEPGEYKVTLKSGSFSKKIAATISRGAYLSVEIEVAGVRYGPSTIVTRSYQPEWDYEFPRPVRWKAGDTVRILVTDNYYWKRKMVDVTFENTLAMRHLCGEVEVKYGSLTFESDFTLPTLPRTD